MIKVIKPEKAAEILKEHGYTDANPNKIKQGIVQGIFPFGVAIMMSKHYVYDIYEALLLKWIKEREENEQV